MRGGANRSICGDIVYHVLEVFLGPVDLGQLMSRSHMWSEHWVVGDSLVVVGGGTLGGLVWIWVRIS